MARPRILVTRRWPEPVERRLAERYDCLFNTADVPMSEAALKSAARDVDALCPTVTDRVGADVLGGARLKLIANYGVGYNHIDIEAARRAGIVVTNTPGVLTDATADLAILLMLMIARRAGEGEREVRAKAWTGWRPTHLIGAQMSGKTLGIIGFGRIGRAVARRAHFGFGMPVLYHSRRRASESEEEETKARHVEDLRTLVAASDFVSLHCPGGAETRGLIGANMLKAMQPTAFIINTSRGEVVDEAALIAALKNGTIAGAGLDVYEREPQLSPGLLELQNVVLLPHLGSATAETRIAMGLRVADNLDLFFAGKPVRDRVA